MKEYVVMSCAAQGLQSDVGDVHVVDQDLSFLDFVVADNQAQNGGFSRTGCADKGAGLLGLDDKGDVLEDPVFSDIGEPYMAEFDFSFEMIYVDRIGQIRWTVEPDLFSAIVQNIVAQQISGKAAESILARVGELLREITPKAVAKTDVQAFRHAAASLAFTSGRLQAARFLA